ncbi:MAG: cysteine--tRNA ligase [Succinivibrionaceae bacterium]|nr:cysteine--tRNA ligase [Succinivibrionaceae bacterium]
MLQIHNSLTKRKEPFTPIEPGKIGMYVCGVTVYDLCHIGHARTFVNFDVVVRYLRYRGYEVNYVRNITDIDDKIIRRAHERGVDPHDLAEEYIVEMHRDFDALGILRPSLEPRATDHIAEIISLTARLLEEGHAYVLEGGDVVFNVDSFPEYGRLSGQRMDALEAGARVGVNADKHNPNDFVLWKMSKPGEPAWDSPWGKGRPGWHIECSAMNCRHLGAHFDIHGGGSDLLFPHHENEIAQSRCAYHTPYVNYWMHSGMVMINDEKMSKSLNNFFTIRDVLREYDPETVRLFLMSGQYRSPLNYSRQNLEQARAGLTRLYTAVRGRWRGAPAGGEDLVARFVECMDDDFNTPGALSVLFELARLVNREADEGRCAGLVGRLLELSGVLGLLGQDPEAFLKGAAGSESGVDSAAIEALIAERRAARERRDFKAADEARDRLTAMGVVIEDGPAGTTWHLK